MNQETVLKYFMNFACGISANTGLICKGSDRYLTHSPLSQKYNRLRDVFLFKKKIKFKL